MEGWYSNQLLPLRTSKASTWVCLGSLEATMLDNKWLFFSISHKWLITEDRGKTCLIFSRYPHTLERASKPFAGLWGERGWRGVQGVMNRARARSLIYVSRSIEPASQPQTSSPSCFCFCFCFCLLALLTLCLP